MKIIFEIPDNSQIGDAIIIKHGDKETVCQIEEINSSIDQDGIFLGTSADIYRRISYLLKRSGSFISGVDDDIECLITLKKIPEKIYEIKDGKCTQTNDTKENI